MSQLMKKNEVQDIQARVNTTMLNVVDKTVIALNKLNDRLDAVDDAIAAKIDLASMDYKDLCGYFMQIKESFKIRQEFLKALQGFGVDTSQVPQEVEDTSTPIIDVTPEDAKRIRAEIEKRNRV